MLKSQRNKLYVQKNTVELSIVRKNRTTKKNKFMWPNQIAIERAVAQREVQIFYFCGHVA